MQVTNQPTLWPNSAIYIGSWTSRYKECVQFWPLCQMFVKQNISNAKGCGPTLNYPTWKTTYCRLSATVYSVHAQPLKLTLKFTFLLKPSVGFILLGRHL
jgi:hypothetical protein